MAQFKAVATVEAKAIITFGECELRALDAMTGYGIEAFLKVFYAELGEANMRPYEQDLRALFATLNPPVSEALAKVNQARRVLEEASNKSGVKDAPQN
ncbi:hypothetical protein [Pseudovibrio sp. Tun.PSC04-5.I4]|uniref:hypothetical protein n=1 Tax=Pseudovibrio sp. Tun.PSC04-5.I4 TaxID=1798213 RepID=UPI0008849CB0|nr:hypothetical protein [Pseudovibrio sp. Tun.PSC04-5.I4]SDQ99360.1 hypothetical protein SAMN04515695_2218 [Pseudovibrio sp. Tun.PSC04-5.I4]